MLHLMGAELFGMALLGPVDDPATARWARAQLSRTTLATTISATHAVCRVHLGPLAQPGRGADRGGHHGPGPRRAARPPAQAGPGDPGRDGALRGRRSRGLHQRAAIVRPRFARGMLVGRAWPRQRAAHTSLTRPARARHPEPAGYSASVQGPLTGSAAASPFRVSRSTSVAVGHRAGRSWSGATTGGSGLPVGSRAVHVPGADRARRNTVQRTGLRRCRHELQGALRALSAELDRDPGMAQAARTWTRRRVSRGSAASAIRGLGAPHEACEPSSATSASCSFHAA